jgi:hypothetical protein
MTGSPGSHPPLPVAIRCLAATYYDGFHIKPHRHHWSQLIYAAAGVMRVRADGTLWIVPPARAVWVPAGVEHEILARGDFAMRTLYFPTQLVPALPRECCALDVTPLLRELVLELVERCPVAESDTPGMRLAAVTIDRIAEAHTLPLHLPLPSDPRALRLAELLRDEPSSRAALAELARTVAAPRQRAARHRRAPRKAKKPIESVIMVTNTLEATAGSCPAGRTSPAPPRPARPAMTMLMIIAAAITTPSIADWRRSPRCRGRSAPRWSPR